MNETVVNSSSLANSSLTRNDTVTDSSTPFRSAQNNSAVSIAQPNNNLTIQQYNNVTTDTKYQIQNTKYSATIVVNTTTYPLLITPSATVYDAMRLLQIDSRQPFTFSAKEYPGMGYFVEEINGIANDNKTGKYWILYINGESAKVGVSGYVLKPNDNILWKYEKAKF